MLDYYGVPDVGPTSSVTPGTTTSDRSPDWPRSGIADRLPAERADCDRAHVVAAFGRLDPNVRADTSGADLLRDLPAAAVYSYAGRTWRPRSPRVVRR